MSLLLNLCFVFLEVFCYTDALPDWLKRTVIGAVASFLMMMNFGCCGGISMKCFVNGRCGRILVYCFVSIIAVGVLSASVIVGVGITMVGTV